MDHALEAGRRLRLGRVLGDERAQIVVEIGGDAGAEGIDIDRAAASRSSRRASRRCSSVAYSWLRSLAASSARCSALSRLFEKDGKGNLLFLHGAL
jgi:hypothetical protein